MSTEGMPILNFKDQFVKRRARRVKPEAALEPLQVWITDLLKTPMILNMLWPLRHSLGLPIPWTCAKH